MARAFIPHVVTEDSALGGSFIENSLRFHSNDSHHLKRTPPSAGNRKTFTFSAWVKRSNLGRGVLLGSATSLGSQESGIEFDGNVIRCYQYTGSFNFRIKTNAQYRDASAWYHIVFALDTTQASSNNRAKLYVNGEQVTDLSANEQPSQNLDCAFLNTTTEHRIGQLAGSHNFDGYMAEINFIDGLQLDPTYFGYTEFQTGIWKPKRYTGTYNTNGYHLEFKDTSSTTAATLGKDTSGNGNNFTPDNYGGTLVDNVIDSPTNNFPMMFSDISTPSLPATVSEAGLRVAGPSNHGDRFERTIGGMPNSGKYYVEVKCISVGARGTIGMYDAHENGGSTDGGTSNWFAFGYHNGGYSTSWTRPNYSQFGNFQTNEYMTIALDMDNGKIWLNRNAAIDTTTQAPRFTDVNTSSPDRHYAWFYRETSGSPTSTAEFNFGQRPYNFTPPAGFKPLSTNNFPTQRTPHVISPKRHFGTLLYTGDGSSNNRVTGLQFKPDLVWIKSRTTTDNHILQDSVRGNYILYPNLANADGATGGGWVKSFNDDGFTTDVNGPINTNGQTHVAWCWKAGGGGGATNNDGSITSTVSANQEAGFSIVTYSGNGSGSGQTVGHGLGKAPKVIFLKKRNAATNWYVYHGAAGNGAFEGLNTTAAYGSGNAPFNTTAPSSTVVTLGNTDGNQSGINFVLYCWAEIPGYSKFGVYRGNNNSDGPYIHLGFRPAWVMIKNTAAGSTEWYILDGARDPDNPVGQYLSSSSGAAEATYIFYDFLSNGFKLRNTGAAQNPNNQDIIYMAFAEQPGSTAYDTETNAR